MRELPIEEVWDKEEEPLPLLYQMIFWLDAGEQKSLVDLT